MVQENIVRDERQMLFEQELNKFMDEWNNGEKYITVHTSGSTGVPKELKVEKCRMENSARMTCRFLDLKQGDTALLCMPLRYIAGKMVVVRSIVASLKLWSVAPSNHPLKGLEKAPVFAAMVPMQVYSSLQVPEEAILLRQIHQLIIGGGAIDETLAVELRDFPHAVWSTYGMTETLSHIALRRLNGNEASQWYTPFDSVKIRLMPEGTLAIHAPAVCDGELLTNDLAEFNEKGQFRIIGRKDNIINSGGIKIQIEEVESRLAKYLFLPYQVTSVPDVKFGEAVVLLLQNKQVTDSNKSIFSLADIIAVCANCLDVYQRPKHIIFVPYLPFTGTGKPDRAKAKEIAKHELKKQ